MWLPLPAIREARPEVSRTLCLVAGARHHPHPVVDAISGMQNDDRIFAQTRRHLGFQVIDVADFHRLEIDGSINVEAVHRRLMTLAEQRSDG